MSNKKIVFVINNFSIGGVELLLLDLMAHLVSVGYEVHIVTILGSGVLEVKFKDIHVSIHHAEGHDFTDKKFSKLCWIIASPIILVRLIKILKKTKPDIVVTSLYQADILGIFGSFLCGIKKRIIIQHDIQALGLIKKQLKKFFACNFTTDAVAVSSSAKDFLISYFKVPHKKIAIIQNGINIEKFERAINLRNEKTLVFGIVGRLEPVKGHIYLLEALKILKNRDGLEPRVLIAGEGSLHKDFSIYIHNNQLNNITLVGSVDNVPDFLKSIDVLVVPSLAEGFGLVVLEGLIARKIVVASDIGAFKELIDSGHNGLLFENANSLDLAEKIKSLILNPAIINTYHNNLETWINENGNTYSAKNMALKYEHLFTRNK